jgi:energy-coupling factor transporter ATP-binding protein EcfA2
MTMGRDGRCKRSVKSANGQKLMSDANRRLEMSVATMILGESGSGKSTSLRGMDPASTLLIQAVKKPLPFKAKEWRHINDGGNVYVSDRSDVIIRAMHKTKRPIIVLDDFQYVLANEFMRRNDEKSYDKFNDIGRHAWDILMAASSLPDNVRVYILGHTQTDDNGRTKAKTVGKMLDDKITVEGLFSIVLKTVVQNGNYLFSTRNNGSDTTKAPLGMFDDELIENDLSKVDSAIYNYYELKESN